MSSSNSAADEALDVLLSEPNRVRDTQMGELAAVAEPIDRGSRYPEAIRDLSDAQQALRCTPSDLQPRAARHSRLGAG